MAQLNQGLENLKTGNQLKLMGAEAAFAAAHWCSRHAAAPGHRETGRQQRLDTEAGPEEG